MQKVNGFTIPDGFKVVSKEHFFSTVGQRDVHPRPEKFRSVWETRHRWCVGYSFPGYLCQNETSGAYETQEIYAVKE